MKRRADMPSRPRRLGTAAVEAVRVPLEVVLVVVVPLEAVAVEAAAVLQPAPVRHVEDGNALPE